MRTKILLSNALVWLCTIIYAQTPQHVTQGDKEQVNFWESNTAMLIGASVILLLIIARTWSKKIHKKRDEVIEEKEEEK